MVFFPDQRPAHAAPLGYSSAISAAKCRGYAAVQVRPLPGLLQGLQPLQSSRFAVKGETLLQQASASALTGKLALGQRADSSALPAPLAGYALTLRNGLLGGLPL